MRKLSWKYILAMFVACIWRIVAFPQITSKSIQDFISEKNNLNKTEVKFLSEVKEFYSRLNYNTAWIQKDNLADYNILLNDLKLSEGFGLSEKDYQFSYIESLRNGTAQLKNIEDSLEAEVRITDAATHFYSDIVYGNSKLSLDYYGLNYTPRCKNIPALLTEYISKNKLHFLINYISPSSPEIAALENKIKWFHTIMANSNFSDAIITSKKITGFNTPLISKFYQLGIINSPDTNMPDSLLKHKLEEAQRQFDLVDDGVLGTNSLRELNVPLSIRLQQLNLAVNYFRWLHCLIQNQSVIVVNIPAAYLKVYRDNKVILEMRMIVGKKTTPTHTLTSTIQEVILYPYWHVPLTIATKELLPEIKRNLGYIAAGNYQVLNKAGKIVDPYSIDWNALSKSYFPYIIRQSTGCDNSLGLLKLNFYNPFGAYLHDTPTKNLFKQYQRFYSHGCMRMEKPMQLGYLVLKNNQIAIDTLEQKGCLRNQSPIAVPADEHMPVIVWYNPAGIDSTGRVIFYKDVYGKFNWMKKN